MIILRPCCTRGIIIPFCSHGWEKITALVASFQPSNPQPRHRGIWKLGRDYCYPVEGKGYVEAGFSAALKYLIQRKQLESSGGYHWWGLPRGAPSTDWTSVRGEAGGCFGKGGEGTGAHGWGRNKKPRGRKQPGKTVKLDERVWRATSEAAALTYAVIWASSWWPELSTLSRETQTHLSWSPEVSAGEMRWWW